MINSAEFEELSNLVFRGMSHVEDPVGNAGRRYVELRDKYLDDPDLVGYGFPLGPTLSSNAIHPKELAGSASNTAQWRQWSYSAGRIVSERQLKAGQESGKSSPIDLAEAIKQADWDQISSHLTSNPSVVARIGSAISEIESCLEVSGLSNSQRAQVRSLTRSLSALVESPEPEWKLICETLVVMLVSRPISAAINAAAILVLIRDVLTYIGVV